MEFVSLSGVREFSTTVPIRRMAANAVKRLQQQSISQGNDRITLDEINHEIKMTRKQMKK